MASNQTAGCIGAPHQIQSCKALGTRTGSHLSFAGVRDRSCLLYGKSTQAKAMWTIVTASLGQKKQIDFLYLCIKAFRL